ncbi:DUF202 domain-containing protein [Paenibacillus sp. LMG 31458]|uniref:DUF202 domain-containing protein n=1 Tax=Paenibacillus phytorum TaxID=2654977 RepID=A0ABX1XZD3_9BACL|nr:DUF202 domain-containing protein [Paenibacillus phytorum]NOU73599.1 DUF202 domain-containing protein [Paenibacillus phytorum]
MNTNNQSNESTYIQQHLANERTFLAWVRTGITIVGLGFLSAGVVFRSTPYDHVGHLIAMFVGVSAVIFGGLIFVLATRDFFAKREGINNQTFRSPSLVIWTVFCSLALIDLFVLILVLVLLLF